MQRLFLCGLLAVGFVGGWGLSLCRFDEYAKSRLVLTTIDANLDYVGNWRMVGEDGKTSCHFLLREDGSAIKSHAPAVAGVWRWDADRVVLVWGDGWRDELVPMPEGVVKRAFKPGGVGPTNTQVAMKE